MIRPTAVATARPPIPGKPILPRQVSKELDEKLSQRTKSADFGTHQTCVTKPETKAHFDNSFIKEPLVEPDYHLFEVLCDFNADEYCRSQNLGDSFAGEFLSVNERQSVNSNGIDQG